MRADQLLAWAVVSGVKRKKEARSTWNANADGAVIAASSSQCSEASINSHWAMTGEKLQCRASKLSVTCEGDGWRSEWRMDLFGASSSGVSSVQRCLSRRAALVSAPCVPPSSVVNLL